MAILSPKKMKLSRESMEYFTTWTFPDYEVNWHHRTIFDTLDKFIHTDDIKRLMIFVGPRHGKSEIVSRRLPAFLFGRFPNHSIIAASYSDDLASSMNRDVQRIIDSESYRQIFPETKLSQGHDRYKRTDDYFEIVGGNGYYRSAGVGGGITGKGCDCFLAGTLISCYQSNKPIEAIVQGDLVLSYDHINGKTEYMPVIKTQRKLSDDIIEIKTSQSKTIKCTADHRIFTENGYCKAIDCIEGNRLVAINSPYEMQFMQKSLYKKQIRCFEGDQKQLYRPLLFGRLLKKSPCNKKQKTKKMRYMRIGRRKSSSKILCKMQGYGKFQNIKTNKMPNMRNRISTKFTPEKVLFKKVFKHFTFASHEKNRKSSIYCRKRISGVVFKIKSFDNGARRQPMCDLLRKNNVKSSPYRRNKNKQLSCKFNNIMQQMPYETPQVSDETISSIKKISIRQVEVYDIQIEKNHNFFAQGILVHNCLIIDDPIKNQEEADSPTYREKIWNWYTSTAYTRLEKNAKIILMMTRWHEDDIAGRLLEKAKSNAIADQWHVLSFPAIAETKETNREIGDALWPTKYSLENLATIKATVGARVWNSLFQQRPSASEGGIFKRHHWRYYDSFPPKFDKIIQSWDLTFKKKDDNDFVAGHVIGKVGTNSYLLDRIHARMTFTESLSAVENMTIKWPDARAKYIEAKANGDALVDILHSKIPGLILVEPRGGKYARANAITPFHEAGNLYLPSPKLCPWVSEFIEQHANFPNDKHDDDVDAFSQGITNLMGDPREKLRKLLGGI